MSMANRHWAYQAFIAWGINGGTMADGKAAILSLGISGLDADKLETIIEAKGKQSALGDLFTADYEILEQEVTDGNDMVRALSNKLSRDSDKRLADLFKESD